MKNSQKALIQETCSFADRVRVLQFAEPTAYVYHPLDYASKPHHAYLQKWGGGKKKVLFLGMNPGPWGMAQTGVPFGEVAAVRDWLGIQYPVDRPAIEHPKRPITGFACTRSEVSGRRLWGLFRQRFQQPEAFFEDHFVLNYCPLVFMEESGRNRTPDKLPANEREPLERICDDFLSKAVAILSPEVLVGVGGFAEAKLKHVFPECQIYRILHPSPASPAANADWAGAATQSLREAGIWK